MDISAWLVSGALPAAIAAGACWLSYWLAGSGCCAGAHAAEPLPTESTGPELTGPDLAGASSRRGRLAPAVLGLGWAVAVAAALIGQRHLAGDESSHWWPEDFWQRGYWWLLIAAVTLSATAWAAFAGSSARWVAAGVLAMGTAAGSLPTGAGWEDTFPLHAGWGLLLGSACLLAFWSLDRLARRRSERWFPLVVLAMLAGPMLVAATTYGALVQWTIAAIAATLVCVIAALAGRLPGGIGIAYPAAAFFTVLMAAGRFYSYEDHPWWSYLGLLLLAPAVSSVDRLIARRGTGLRAMVAAGVAAALIAASAAWHLRDLQ